QGCRCPRRSTRRGSRISSGRPGSARPTPTTRAPTRRQLPLPRRARAWLVLAVCESFGTSSGRPGGPPSGSTAFRLGQGPDFAHRRAGKVAVPAEATARHLPILVESGAKWVRHQLDAAAPGSPTGRAVAIVVVEIARYGVIDTR